MTLIKPPCCNITNVPLSTAQAAEIRRTDAAASGLTPLKSDKAYIIAHLYCEQSAYISEGKTNADVLTDYYGDIWGAVYAGVGFDDSYDTCLIEVDRQYAEFVVNQFETDYAPTREKELVEWLKQYNGTLIKCEPHPIDPDWHDETMPTIAFLRHTSNGAEVYLTTTFSAHGFFGCRFEGGLDPSYIESHINYLLEIEDSRLLSYLKANTGITGTCKTYCLQAALEWKNDNDIYFDKWHSIDLATTNLFDTDEIENFITVTL